MPSYLRIPGTHEYRVSQVLGGTRFFLTAEGLSTDIEDRAAWFGTLDEADAVATAANQDQTWLALKGHWNVESPVHALPYPWCRGNPTTAQCYRDRHCLRDPNCGE